MKIAFETGIGEDLADVQLMSIVSSKRDLFEENAMSLSAMISSLQFGLS